MPAAAPEIAEILRLVLGWAWTYVIVAELIGSSSGIGHMIIDSQALLATGQIIFGIIVIGLIGLVSDFLFKAVNRGSSRGASREQHDPPHRRTSSRVFPGVRGGAPDAGAGADRPRRSPTNDFITILGPSGCGKSTLLRIVAGLDRPTDGPRAARRRAVIGSGRRPRHGVPVLHAVSLAHGRREHRLRPAREGRAEARAPARSSPILHRQGRPRAASSNHYPKQLSGGMQQRTAIARALANDPEILLLDEPFGALDNQTRALMQELLLGIWERERKTVLFVTHDIEEAIFLANRVVVMTARPGRIKADIAVDLPHPRHYRMKTTPEFSDLKARLTEEIRVEAMQAEGVH